MSGTLITTPFGPASTAAEVIAGVDLAGRRAVVTGASSGIGQETARVLAGAGAEVTLAVRDVTAGQRAAGEIEDWLAGHRDSGGRQPAGLHVARLDLSDQASVAAFVLGWQGPLHILVNNAGVMATPELRTPEGWELQFATNHLGHFALATGLRASLAAGADGQSRTARVVSVSSLAHVMGGVELDDVNFERRPYSPFAGYAQSKTANVLFAVEAARRWAGDGITVNAAHPGRITSTALYRHVDGAGGDGQSAGKDIPQGAATQVLLAASPLVEGVTGTYFADCQQAPPFVPGGPRQGVADHALDPEQAARLWELSQALLAGARS
jgi:NAD(P)-dependent dehydrogenase (short-subunit alcohol dehydrogenase family)